MKRMKDHESDNACHLPQADRIPKELQLRMWEVRAPAAVFVRLFVDCPIGVMQSATHWTSIQVRRCAHSNHSKDLESHLSLLGCDQHMCSVDRFGEDWSSSSTPELTELDRLHDVGILDSIQSWDQKCAGVFAQAEEIVQAIRTGTGTHFMLVAPCD